MNNKDADNKNGIKRRDFLKLAAVAAAGAVTGLSGRSAFASKEGVGSSAASSVRNTPEVTNQKIKIQPPKEKIRYDILDAHLHFADFLEQSDGFPALCDAMDMAGVSQAVIFGMGIAKQWDETMTEPPSYYLSNDSRCYYYSATDFLMAEELLAQPKEIR